LKGEIAMEEGKIIRFPVTKGVGAGARCIPVHKMMQRIVLEEIANAWENNSAAYDCIPEVSLSPEKIVELSLRRRVISKTNQE
jgi:hypothetical protein